MALRFEHDLAPNNSLVDQTLRFTAGWPSVYQRSVTLDDVFQIFQQSFPDLKADSKFNPYYYEGGDYRLKLNTAGVGGVAFYWHHVPTSTDYNGMVRSPEDVRAEIDNGSEVFAKRAALLTLARGRLGPQVAVTFGVRTAQINNLILSNPQAIDRVLGIG